MINALEISIIAGTFVVLLGAILTYCVRLNTQMSMINVDIATLKVQVSPLWAKVQSQIASDLHHPHPRYAEMDKMLEKLEALTITDSERSRLKELLLERSRDNHPDITDDQREKAKLMIVVMDMVLAESVAGPDSKMTIALVESKKTSIQSKIAVEAVKEALSSEKDKSS